MQEEDEYDESQAKDEQQYDEDGNKIYKIPEMTPLERQEFEDSKRRHRENITQDQVVMKKTFKGLAFLPKPDKIIFKDFAVGETMTQTIYLTNVSYSFNSFKLLPIKESIKDFFEIIYTPSGKISAGISVPITIRFLPQLNEDINDIFPILAQTGKIDIPLICTCKKAIVKISQPYIDFGNVIFGEKKTENLKLVNEGAFSTEIKMKNIQGVDLFKAETSSLASSVVQSRIAKSVESESKEQQDDEQGSITEFLEQLKFNKIFTIQGYSPLNIPFTYIPNKIGDFELPLLVYFENYLYSPPIKIFLRGKCVEVPIYVEKPVYDFEICLLQHIYREKLVFYNRSQNAMKIQIIAPRETKNFFEFNPMLAYIQGNSACKIWVKMNADKEILNICGKYMKGDCLEIPFKLVGADQELPVCFIIKARLTYDTIEIYPQKLDFGKIFEGSGSRVKLIFTNLSSLPQQLLFYPLPLEISIEPDLIPLNILPKSKLETHLVYRAKNIKKDEAFLTCKIVTGKISTKDIRIPYQCEIIKCPLEFNLLKVDMPVLQINEKYSVNLKIKNVTNKDIVFEFFLQYFEICGIKMTPMVQKLEAQKSVDIYIEYQSFFKKLGAFTMEQLKQKYENDPSKNFNLRLKMQQQQSEQQQDQSRPPSKQQEKQPDLLKGKKQNLLPDKKDTKKMSKQQQKDFELEQQRIAELEQQKQEEERKRIEKIEQEFNMIEELFKLGGKFYEFHEGSPNHSQHYVWLIPCYFKFDKTPDSTKQVIYLEMTTTTVEQSLVVSSSEIDFGEIAVGFPKTKQLTVKNEGNDAANLKMDILPLYGGFSVTNALRTVEPGDVTILNIQFEPHLEQLFKQTLKIFCDTLSVSVKLKGKGVKPAVQLDQEKGLLNAGSVLIGEYSERTFKITNISTFKIQFSLISKAKGIQNRKGTQVFSYIPQEGEIESQSSIEIKVIFKPDVISEKFYEMILIDVPNQKIDNYLFLYGQCFPRQAYITHYSPHLELPALEEITHRLENPLDMLKKKDEENVFSQLNNQILLEFVKPKNDEDQNPRCKVLKLLIGNCRLMDQKNEKNVNFEINMPREDKQNFFSVDNPKGTVAGNQEIVVAFSFKPPPVDQFVSSIEALQQLGQWIEQKAELKLSGGFIKQNAADLVTYDITLKAYINQI